MRMKMKISRQSGRRNSQSQSKDINFCPSSLSYCKDTNLERNSETNHKTSSYDCPSKSDLGKSRLKVHLVRKPIQLKLLLLYRKLKLLVIKPNILKTYLLKTLNPRLLQSKIKTTVSFSS